MLCAIPITVLAISALFLIATGYQNRMLSRLSADTSSRQQQAITDINGQTMDKVIRDSMKRTTYLESQITDELFNDCRIRVKLLAEYADRIFSDPGTYPAEYAGPDPALNGQITAQVILAEGTDPGDQALQRRLGIAANMSDIMASMYRVSAESSFFILLVHERGTLYGFNAKLYPSIALFYHFVNGLIIISWEEFMKMLISLVKRLHNNVI